MSKLPPMNGTAGTASAGMSIGFSTISRFASGKVTSPEPLLVTRKNSNRASSVFSAGVIPALASESVRVIPTTTRPETTSPTLTIGSTPSSKRNPSAVSIRKNCEKALGYSTVNEAAHTGKDPV